MVKPAYTGKVVKKPSARPMTLAEIKETKKLDIQFSKHGLNTKSKKNIAYWLQAETEVEFGELLDMFWGFHDFRIEKVNYTSSKDQIDVLLEYDTHEFSVLLRFIGNVSMNFQPVQDYDVDWLTGASIGKNEQGQIVWVGSDDIDANELPDDIIWIAGDSIRYAYIDKNGEPRKLPEDMIHQVWHTLNYETGKYEDIEKEFHPKYCETK